MRKLLTLAFFLFSFGIYCQGEFRQTPEIKAAYELIMDLRLTEAQSQIQLIRNTDPDNLLVLHLENYIDFFTIFIDEDKKQFEVLEKNKKKRLRYIEKHGDKNSPYYLFVQAEIQLQWALVRAKFDEVFSAASEIYSAYRLLDENQVKFPSFIANKKSLSAIHVLVESIPGIVRRIFSIKGTISQGTKEIEEVIVYSKENDFMYHEEAVAIYSYILYFQNNKKQEAWDFLEKSNLDHKTSPLLCFLKASMAQKIGNNDAAIKILEERPTDSDYHPFHYLDFLYGKSKLYRLDRDANVPLLHFLEQFHGAHYIKEAHQKMAWYEIVINHDAAAYTARMKQVKDAGQDLIDGDKQAKKEAASRTQPDSILLKARLLYDGGYYARAKKLLLDRKGGLAFTDATYLEYHYRLGRITQKLEEMDKAIDYLSITLDEGAKNELYFACNAALQLGLIYEKKGDQQKAVGYFEECLDLSPSDYKNSLHQKAKSGLNRIKSQ